MAYQKEEVIFTIAYDKAGSIVEVTPASGYTIVEQGSFSPQHPYSLKETRLLQSNTTIILHTSSSPDCWWIIDPATGTMRRVCG